MSQTMLSEKSPLLAYAASKLSPEVFSHPVWMRFGKKQILGSLDIVEDLISAARNLRSDDPSSACQVLLIGAVYQNYNGQRPSALKTAQQALALAELTGLSRETLWAIWATCAISIQQGNYDQAATHFVDLQAALNEQSEWILADFVDVLRRALFQSEAFRHDRHSKWSRDRPFGDLLGVTFDWLQNWGFSAQASESEFEFGFRDLTSQTANQSELPQTFFSIQRWEGRWHTLMLAIRGELKLHWGASDEVHSSKRFSFWASLLSSLRLYLAGRHIDTRVVDRLPQPSGVSVLPPAKESSPSNPPAGKEKPALITKQVNRAEHLEQASVLVPVAVHMLGAFSLTIGDLTVKLRASRGLSLLKYLLLHHKQNTPREVLMDTFWPEVSPETARNNLNVAIHSLRKALRTKVFLPVIGFEDGAYGLEPNLQVWLDVEEFERCVQAGQRFESRNQLTAAVGEYEAATSLYQGDLLEQNPYEEWTILDRERLRITYLDTLDRLSQIYFSQERYAGCITSCQLILRRDSCREDTHCLLMRCYSRQGQYHLALRQYQVCVEALRSELEVEPAPETTQLHDRIRRREQV